MQRLILCVLLAAGWLVLVAGPASACLWDRETVHHEKEFRSNYLDRLAETPSDGPYEKSPPALLGVLAGGGGLLMLVGAVIVGLVRGMALQRGQASQNRFNEDRP
jgi:hypothetical protein